MIETLLLRTVVVVLLGSLAYFFNPFALSAPVAGIFGVILAGIVILLERRLKRASLTHLIGAATGAITALICTLLLSVVLERAAGAYSLTHFIVIAFLALGTYIGLAVGAKKGEMLNLGALGGLIGGEKSGKSSFMVLDTSVIIDGRIADVAETGFVDGTMAIPQFVLRELQMVADSADSLKRNRGRRGLDILQRLQKSSHVKVQILEDDFPNVRDVDMKLVEVGKRYACRVLTNDFNLNKVAQLHGVHVLNINELANALRPIVLPGEIMRVFVIKEGKEYNQGVAYLDDGTMVVVDNARRMISKTIDIAVTSVLQTTAGKMIFGRFDERIHAVYDKTSSVSTTDAGHHTRGREHSATAAPQTT
ncbi:MAG: PIN domain nuclease [Bryobacteraceae bacterium]|nr:PIN domain nuclease [Bryobacteraceae bacterium]